MAKLTRQAYLRQMSEEQRLVKSPPTAQRIHAKPTPAETSEISPFTAGQARALHFQQTRGNQAMLRVMRTARDTAANRVQRVEGEEKEKEKDPARVEGPNGGPSIASQFMTALSFWENLARQADAGDQGSSAYGSPDMEANRDVSMSAYGGNDYDDANDNGNQLPAGAYGTGNYDDANEDVSQHPYPFDPYGDSHNDDDSDESAPYEDRGPTFNPGAANNSFDGMPELEDDDRANDQGQLSMPSPAAIPALRERRKRRYRYLKQMGNENIGEDKEFNPASPLSGKGTKEMVTTVIKSAKNKFLNGINEAIEKNNGTQDLEIDLEQSLIASIRASMGWQEDVTRNYVKFKLNETKTDLNKPDFDVDFDQVGGKAFKLREDAVFKTQYLQGDEKKQFQVKGNGGTLMQGNPPQPYATDNDHSKFSGAGFAIYVMSPGGKFYAGTHKVGLFHHSSFLAGGDVAGAGEWKVENGTLKEITNKSGHYKPGDNQLLQTLNELQSLGVNLGPVVLKVLGSNSITLTVYPGGAAKFLQDKGNASHQPDEL